MKKYRRNQTGKYVKSNYANLAYWASLLTFGTILTLVLNMFAAAVYKELEILRILMMSQLFCLFTIIFVKLIEFLINFSRTKSLLLILQEKHAKREIEKSLLHTMTLNKSKDELNVIHLPDVCVRFSGSQRVPKFEIKVEKLAGMYDIDKLKEDVDSSLKSGLRDFGVVSYRISDDKLYFLFDVENLAQNKTFVPKSIDDLENDAYILQLQNDLVIDLNERPHIAIFGKTGAGKSTLLYAILYQLLLQNADVFVLDKKFEFSSLVVSKILESHQVATNNDNINLMLDDILMQIDERQKIMSHETEKRKKFGLKASDVNLRPICLVADEVGAIVADMTTKEKNEFYKKLTSIILRGRSVGINVIVATQNPGVDTIPQNIRSQFSTKILLGSANKDIQKMALDESLDSEFVQKYTGFYVSNGLTIKPKKFFGVNLHANKLFVLSSMYAAKQKGLNRQYNQRGFMARKSIDNKLSGLD